MVKITFKTESGIYWSICENLNYDRAGEWYLLNSVLENSQGSGPVTQAIVPVGWQIIQVEEA